MSRSMWLQKSAMWESLWETLLGLVYCNENRKEGDEQLLAFPALELYLAEMCI